MKEDFVQYVWKFKLFNLIDLKTSNGKTVEIINVGLHNLSSGPDFSNAKIKIDGQLWVGNVEIHLTQKDWNLHRHQFDESYNNVILHVVYKSSDLEVKTQSDRVLETIFIEHLVFDETKRNYDLLMKEKISFVPCEKLVDSNKMLVLSQYDRVLTERIERKINDIEKDIELSDGDLDKAFLISLFKYFGAPQNKAPFEVLARNIEIKHLIKQAVSVESIEALLFGMAGFFDAETDCDYKNKLENEFIYQKQLYQLSSPMKLSNWKFAAVRPANFPSIRIAQLSVVLFQEQRWFSYIQKEEEVSKIREKFNFKMSDFWQTHYNFGFESKATKKQITDAFYDKIMINVIVPFLFYYGKFVQDEKYKERAFEILLSLKPENNKITNSWQGIGFSNDNAFESQALLELKNSYCNQKKCLECSIGYKILNK